ncbi:zinc finger MYM-type protein 2, partial [Clonorchis sinensis]
MNSLVKHCPLPRTDGEISTAESIEALGHMTPISGDGDLIQEDDCGNRDIHQYSSHARSSDGSVGDGTTGTTSLLDEALSAAMEAIADANRFNAASNNCDTETVSCSDVATNHPPISSITSSMESTDKLESHPNLRSDRFFPSASSSFDFVKDMDYAAEKMQVDHDASENSKSKTDWVPTSPGTQDTKATNALALISLGSSLGTLTSFFANWRPILRPLFERTLIERLWSFGELGATGPQPLLLSMWFIISRHFGVGCRTEHAKLVYGNVDIGTDPVTGQKQLQFFRTVRPLVGNQAPSSESPNSFRSSEPNVVVPEQPDKPDRCPVWLFERFRAHRPFTVNFPSCPLYLQPERHASMNTPLMGTDNDIIWYTTNGLGKNKIGAMLNLALQNVGVPIVRQINLSRFCDALAAAVLTPAGGEVGARLGELVKMCKQSSDQEPLRQEMESCAERIVNQSTNPDSPIHQLLLRICAAKEKPKTQTRTARNTPKVHTNHDRKDSSVNGSAVHKFSIHSTQAISAHHPPCDSN